MAAASPSSVSVPARTTAVFYQESAPALQLNIFQNPTLDAYLHLAVNDRDESPVVTVTVNDAEFSGFVRTVAKDLLGADAYLDMPSPLMGAEDFSCVLHKVPGAMVALGVRPMGEGPRAPVHSNRMMLNEDGMQAGIALHAAIALRYLE